MDAGRDLETRRDVGDHCAFMPARNNSVTGTSLLLGFGARPPTTETSSMKETPVAIT
jgi:hypothetical protein